MYRASGPTCYRPDLAVRQRGRTARHALPGAWLEHQIAEIEWGAAEITFGDHGGVLTPLDHHPRYSRRPQIAQPLCRYSSALSNPRQSRL
jgi:hypothetical protein